MTLTADVIVGEFNKHLEVGFDDYIPKPIDKKKLNIVLNKALNHVDEEKAEE